MLDLRAGGAATTPLQSPLWLPLSVLVPLTHVERLIRALALLVLLSCPRVCRDPVGRKAVLGLVLVVSVVTAIHCIAAEGHRHPVKNAVSNAAARLAATTQIGLWREQLYAFVLSHEYAVPPVGDCVIATIAVLSVQGTWSQRIRAESSGSGGK